MSINGSDREWSTNMVAEWERREQEARMNEEQIKKIEAILQAQQGTTVINGVLGQIYPSIANYPGNSLGQLSQGQTYQKIGQGQPVPDSGAKDRERLRNAIHQNIKRIIGVAGMWYVRSVAMPELIYDRAFGTPPTTAFFTYNLTRMPDQFMRRHDVVLVTFWAPDYNIDPTIKASGSAVQIPSPWIVPLQLDEEIVNEIVADAVAQKLDPQSKKK